MFQAIYCFTHAGQRLHAGNMHSGTSGSRSQSKLEECRAFEQNPSLLVLALHML